MVLPRVLVVDDEVRSLESIKRILGDRFEVHTAENTTQAQAILEREWIQVLLCDQRMPGMTGIEFTQQVRDNYPNVVRMIISGYTEAADIIDAVNKGGIYQYITKPWHPDELVNKINKAVELFRLQRENEQLAVELKLKPDSIERVMIDKRRTLKTRYDWERAIIRTPTSPMERVCKLIRDIAPFDVSLLLNGESGTGKELCARALHYSSLRQDKPFVTYSCVMMPDEQLESELFGHKRGAFDGAMEDQIGLFERADGGTLFLDGIGDLSAALQIKLLRVLQEKEVRPLGSSRRIPVDVRVISTSGRELTEDLRSGRFRQDLYYQLAAFEVTISPLRERREDIIPLAFGLLEQVMAELGKPVKGISAEALECLKHYSWPGNVSQLRNEIRRMLLLGRESQLGADLLSAQIRQTTSEASPIGRVPVSGTLQQRLDALEAQILEETLLRFGSNRAQAATELGLSLEELASKLTRHALQPGLVEAANEGV